MVIVFTYRISMQHFPFIYTATRKKKHEYYSLYKANWRFVVFRKNAKYVDFPFSMKRCFFFFLFSSPTLKFFQTFAQFESTIILLSTLTPIINCFNLFIFFCRIEHTFFSPTFQMGFWWYNQIKAVLFLFASNTLFAFCI